MIIPIQKFDIQSNANHPHVLQIMYSTNKTHPRYYVSILDETISHELKRFKLAKRK